MAADPLEHRGAAYICLDATPLIHFSDHGFLDTLAALVGEPAFTPHYILDEEIRAPMRGTGRYRANSRILAASWLHGAVSWSLLEVYRD